MAIFMAIYLLPAPNFLGIFTTPTVDFFGPFLAAIRAMFLHGALPT